MVSAKILMQLEDHIYDLVLHRVISLSDAREIVGLLHGVTTGEKTVPLLLVLTIDEAATALRVSSKTIHSYCNAGELTRIKLGYKATRIDVDELKSLIIRKSEKRNKLNTSPNSNHRL